MSSAVFSLIPLAALFAVYVCLLPGDADDRQNDPLNIEESIEPLSLRVVVGLIVALVLYSAAYSAPRPEITSTLLLGLTKALSWHFMIQTVS